MERDSASCSFDIDGIPQNDYRNSNRGNYFIIVFITVFQIDAKHSEQLRTLFKKIITQDWNDIFHVVFLHFFIIIFLPNNRLPVLAGKRDILFVDRALQLCSARTNERIYPSITTLHVQGIMWGFAPENFKRNMISRQRLAKMFAQLAKFLVGFGANTIRGRVVGTPISRQKSPLLRFQSRWTKYSCNTQ